MQTYAHGCGFVKGFSAGARVGFERLVGLRVGLWWVYVGARKCFVAGATLRCSMAAALLWRARGLASSHEGLGRALGRHLHTGFIKVNIQCDRSRMTTRCN
jgi:hypothetical protein